MWRDTGKERERQGREDVEKRKWSEEERVERERKVRKVERGSEERGTKEHGQMDTDLGCRQESSGGSSVVGSDREGH